MSKWTDGFGNKVLWSKHGFYVSYAPADNYVNSETALVAEDQVSFYILNGDHREEYEKRINSWEECYKYFTDNEHLKNNEWSH